MEILIFDTHWQLSATISPYKFTQHHSSEGYLYSSRKTCDAEKLFSENKNWFCQSNPEKHKKKVT